MSDKKASNQMWGGRFASGPAAIMEAINASISFDRKLYAQDIRGSVAHSEMLAQTGIISAADQEKIAHGLNTILKEIEDGTFEFSTRLEDIHMNVEARLADLIGAAAGRLHTARSRNDQVAVDLRLWVKDESFRVAEALKGLIRALLERAEEHAATVMPGFTHMQAAQPVTFGHHCMAYVEMFSRDLSRVRDAIERMDESPLGAAALAGTSFPIDRHQTAKALGFREPMRNSLDSVSDRDFALDFLAMAAICATHLSRLAEEIIIWSTPQFGFVRLSDSFSTGSSIMPQKKNPDAAELVRGKTGRVTGHLVGLLTVMKGMPLTYGKDMQEDKESVFDAAETLDLMLAAMTGMVSDMTVNAAAMKKAAGSGHATATDLADWLVRTLGLPFREAHHVTGRAVALAEEKKVGLEKLSLADLQSINPGITADIFSVLAVQNSVKSRTSFGGTAPSEVKKQIRAWKKAHRKGMMPDIATGNISDIATSNFPDIATGNIPGVQYTQNSAKSGGWQTFRTDGSMTGSRILVTLTLLAALAAVTACGRKAALDSPYEAAVQARKDAEKAKQPLPPEPEKPVEDKKFILDPLI